MRHRYPTLLLVVLSLLCLPIQAEAAEQEMAYDDGSAETSHTLHNANTALAVRFTPPEYPCRLIRTRFFIAANVGEVTNATMWILDDDAPGAGPGTIMFGPVQIELPGTTGWAEFEIPVSMQTGQGSFYIAYAQTVLGFHGAIMGSDASDPDEARSWSNQSGTWRRLCTCRGDLMIRTVVEAGPVPVELTSWGGIKTGLR